MLREILTKNFLKKGERFLVKFLVYSIKSVQTGDHDFLFRLYIYIYINILLKEYICNVIVSDDCNMDIYCVIYNFLQALKVFCQSPWLFPDLVNLLFYFY